MKTSRASPTSVRQMATIWRSAIDRRVERRVEIERDAEAVEHARGLRPHLPPPDQPRAGAEDVAEGDVLGDGHLREQRQVLPDDVDAEAAGGDRRDALRPGCRNTSISAPGSGV